MATSGLIGLTFLLGIILQQVPRSKDMPIIGRWLLMEDFMVFFALMIDEPVRYVKRKLVLFITKRNSQVFQKTTSIADDDRLHQVWSNCGDKYPCHGPHFCHPTARS